MVDREISLSMGQHYNLNDSCMEKVSSDLGKQSRYFSLGFVMYVAEASRFKVPTHSHRMQKHGV
jgi:hypothetical protein